MSSTDALRFPSTNHALRRAAEQPARSSEPRRPLRLALVNDYEIIVRGLHAMLAPYADRVCVVEHEVGGTPDELVDVALFDTFAGRRDALERAGEMTVLDNVRHVVLYTWDASAEFLERARAKGVDAVVLKSSDGVELVETLERVAHGERLGLDHVTRSPGVESSDSLSVREREVLALLALGVSNAEIGAELFLSVDTVKTYVRRVFRKLGVNNRTQAAVLAQRYELAPPTSRLDRMRADTVEPPSPGSDKPTPAWST